MLICLGAVLRLPMAGRMFPIAMFSAFTLARWFSPGGPISLGHVILTVAWVVDDPYHQIVSKEGR